MKKNTMIAVLIAGLTAVSITSCKKNLILTPNDQVTQAQVFSTPAGYKQALAKVYSSYALTGNIAPFNPSGTGDIAGINEGASDFYRLLWQLEELPTDEAVLGYGNDAGVLDLHNMVWDANNVPAQGLYYRSLFQITLCNNFLQQATPAMLKSRGISGADATNIAYYAAECRFLRAYQYSVLMDLYGNPPFVTDATPIGSVIPKPIARAALFAYIEGELKAIDPLMVAPSKNEYGRADEAAVWALLARIYLNAQVYTGTARFTDAITYSQKVIGAGYTLIPKFDNLMLADNNLNSIPGGGTSATNEFIMTINYDGTRTETYGGSQFMVHAAVGGSMPPALFGIAGGYDGSRTTSNIIALFPPPPDTSIANFPNNKNPDTRAEFWYRGQSLTINSVTKFTDGIAVTKYRNVTTTGAQGSDPTFTDMDMPLFRLSEQYLIYAEAALRGGTGTGDVMGNALNYINLIRTRAYAGSTAGNITASQLTLPFILDERARELFWECFRRTDLIRYNLFTSNSYLWPLKGGAPSGIGVAAFRNLYAIPQADIAANPNLKQNPGY